MKLGIKTMLAVVIIIAVLSVLLSLISLRNINNKSKIVSGVKKELAKKRVIYKDPSASSS